MRSDFSFKLHMESTVVGLLLWVVHLANILDTGCVQCFLTELYRTLERRYYTRILHL